MIHSSSTGPIGVFDSGVGGLSVLRAIREQLPTEQLVYVADSNYAPYGEEDVDYILARSLVISRFLVEQNVKAMVVACNTASALALPKLREHFDVPIVGIEPAIKPAVGLTQTGVVGVLATTRTVASPGVTRLCDTHGQDVKIMLQACPGLVERIEQNQLDAPDTYALLSGFLKPVLEADADTIVLGCTHYPFVSDLIQKISGNSVTIIEPGAAVARQLERRLKSVGSLGVESGSAPVERSIFYTTGDAESSQQIVSSLWGKPVDLRSLKGI